MDNSLLEYFKDELQIELDKELNEMPTFSEEMAEHIRNVYTNLNKQREEWLKNKEKEELS